MQYRAEIDGLRAVAVLPVLLFHAGFPAFAGGFTGVDIFFVISGYLITSLILAEMAESRFSIVGFYDRRARRILPALFTVAISAIPFAYLWMTPRQLEDFSESLMAVALSGSNFLFWKEDGYFELTAELKPLLHTWSLGVEEQFYILFPLLILLLWRFGRGQVAAALLLLGIASFLLAEWMSNAAPSANFYLLPSRAWELFAGALCAFYLAGRERQPGPAGPESRSRRLANALALLGLGMILAGFWVIDKSVPFPSRHALLPVVGTVLVILFARRDTIAGRLLALRPFVGIGLISYSLYLWHQPLFAFARLRSEEDPGPMLYLLLIAAAFLLAFLSWRYVERPFRSRDRFNRKQIFTFSGVGILLLICLGAAGDIGKGFPNRLAADGRTLASLEERLRPNNGLSSLCDHSFRIRPECMSGQPPEVVLWGDSYAMHLADALTAGDNPPALIQLTKSVCGPFINLAPIVLPLYGEKWAEDCLNFNAEVMAWLRRGDSGRYVVLSSPFSQYLGEEAEFLTADGRRVRTGSTPENMAIVAKALEETLTELTKAGHYPVVIGPPPRSGRNIGQCLLRAGMFGFDPAGCDFAMTGMEEKSRMAITLLNRVADKYPVIRLEDFICAEGRCRAMKDGTFLYRDAGHLTHEGARLIGREMNLPARIREE
jgi:peptidoglycan/LPS O-acetylase OafA/YrhL|tara:strand:- start:594 stop:2573 length:1980 start_codon:yes stop_codon:yes gene_type:complete